MTEIQSLARGIRILELLASRPEGISITELAADLKVDKGSASRLVQTLAVRGYAEKDGSTRRFLLGSKVLLLSRSLLSGNPLREAAKPSLQQLVQETGECAHLGVCSPGGVLYLDQVESPATLRVNAAVGSIMPYHSTALGKVLLAWNAVPIPKTLEKCTPRTITAVSILQNHLIQTHQRGYAIDNEEQTDGVRCIAAPVLDHKGRVLAAIGISAPSTRLTLRQIPGTASIVMQIAQELTQRVSFPDHR